MTTEVLWLQVPIATLLISDGPDEAEWLHLRTRLENGESEIEIEMTFISYASSTEFSHKISLTSITALESAPTRFTGRINGQNVTGFYEYWMPESRGHLKPS